MSAPRSNTEKQRRALEYVAAEKKAFEARTIIVCAFLGQAMVDARTAQLRAMAEAETIFDAARKRERRAARFNPEGKPVYGRPGRKERQKRATKKYKKKAAQLVRRFEPAELE